MSSIGRTHEHRLILGLACALVIWFAFAKLIVPPLIESAYRGASFSLFNRIITAQHTYPLDSYREQWDWLALRVLVILVASGVLALAITRADFLRTYVGVATPGALGAIRMWTCLILLITLSWEDLSSVALIPAEMRNRAGFMRFLHVLPIGYDAFLSSAKALSAFKTVTELLLFLGVIGWLTRLVVPLATVCGFVMVGILVEHSFFWHQNLVPLYVLAVLSWTRCGDGWSVDRLWKRYRGRPVPAADEQRPVYANARYACWVVIALSYTATGLSKWQDGGLYWWHPTNMRSMLFADALMPREFEWAWSLHLVTAPDAVFAILGLTTLLAETGFAVVLVSSRARCIAPVVVVMMHVGILLFQRILFFDLMLLQLVFFDLSRLGRKVGDLIASLRGRLARSTFHSLDTRDNSCGATASNGECAPPTVARARDLRYALVISALVVVSLICWYDRVEFYPLTSWHLYSGLDTSGKITYLKVLGHYDSAHVAPARLEDGIGALAFDGRYGPTLEKCVAQRQPSDLETCRRFLRANAAAYNAKNTRRLTHYEIQSWTWDFARDAANPQHGQLTKQWVFDVR